jgi:hypothetical protein
VTREEEEKEEENHEAHMCAYHGCESIIDDVELLWCNAPGCDLTVCIIILSSEMVHKLNIFSPSTIYHAKVFSKGLPEAGSVTTSVRKTRDLEWEAENDVERNSVRQTYKEIHDLSSIKFPN